MMPTTPLHKPSKTDALRLDLIYLGLAMLYLPIFEHAGTAV